MCDMEVQAVAVSLPELHGQARRMGLALQCFASASPTCTEVSQALKSAREKDMDAVCEACSPGPDLIESSELIGLQQHYILGLMPWVQEILVEALTTISRRLGPSVLKYLRQAPSL